MFGAYIPKTSTTNTRRSALWSFVVHNNNDDDDAEANPKYFSEGNLCAFCCTVRHTSHTHTHTLAITGGERSAWPLQGQDGRVDQ